MVHARENNRQFNVSSLSDYLENSDSYYALSFAISWLLLFTIFLVNSTI